MKQEVGKAAAVRVNPVQLWGWVRGQRRRIQFSFGRRLKSGEIKDIIGVPTSFQAELAKQYGILWPPWMQLITLISLLMERMKLIRKEFD